MINQFQHKPFLAIGICFFLIVNNLSAQQIPDGYTLTWSDEFEHDGVPNKANWMFENGFVRNKELQWYQSENAECKNGLLVIEARREKKPNPNFEMNSEDWRKSREVINYTSSSLKTKGLQSFQYGIIEVRAKIKTKTGLWPAIWTLGNEGNWPANGECDIMEYYKNQILANFAWGTKNLQQPKWDGKKIPLSNFNDPAFEDKFHVWKLEWTEHYMRIYLDGEMLNEVMLENTVNASDGKNPFQQPHYLLLNLAIGSNGGDPSNTKFPSSYEIDYVRVYQSN